MSGFRMQSMLVSTVLAFASVAFPARAEPFEIVHTTWVGYGPLYLAQDLGYFKEEGVDVKLTTIGEGTSEIQRLVIARQLLMGSGVI